MALSMAPGLKAEPRGISHWVQVDGGAFAMMAIAAYTKPPFYVCTPGLAFLNIFIELQVSITAFILTAICLAPATLCGRGQLGPPTMIRSRCGAALV